MCPNFGTPKNNKFSIWNKLVPNGKFIIFRCPNTEAHYALSSIYCKKGTNNRGMINFYDIMFDVVLQYEL